ncbi:LON peptidase N-terminal domain and RING finger protein 2 [Tritrichomonas musculus]|uniref:LON peptidase N-terminal domain and RING finger protein 2 n=1 Tax=Tritrichomonas musculus TaxID=1915356 RepID=A0ABR2H6S5_9EUKA
MQNYDLQHYIDAKKAIASSVLKYVDNDTNNEDDFQSIIQLIEKYKIQKNSEEFILFIKLIDQISQMHHYSPNTYEKLIKILQFFKEDIIKNFSNEEIFTTFGNKRILLYLIEDNILKIDKSIAQQINKRDSNFRDYFFPEIKPFLDDPKEPKSMPPDFDELRKNPSGKNVLFHCLQTDDLSGFISFIKNSKVSIKEDAKIAPEFYEYYGYFNPEELLFTEYAIYFGSKRILDYLVLKDFPIKQTSIEFAIRGGNLDIFKKLEKTISNPYKETSSWMKTAICAHENEMATYIKDKYLFISGDNLKNYIDRMVEMHNYYFMNPNFKFQCSNIFSFLAFSKSFNLSTILLRNNKINMNEEIILDSIISNLV